MSEKSRLSGPFHKEHSKGVQTLLQCGRRLFYHIYWSVSTYLSWKRSILALCKILRLFVNTLTPDGNYPLLNRGKLTEPLQILLSQKQKTFSQSFSQFLKSTLNFEHFQKKDDIHSRYISQITDSVKFD